MRFFLRNFLLFLAPALACLGSAVASELKGGAMFRTSPLLVNGRLYFIQCDETATALDAADGSVVTRQPLGKGVTRFDVVGNDVVGIKADGVVRIDGIEGEDRREAYVGGFRSILARDEAEGLGLDPAEEHLGWRVFGDGLVVIDSPAPGVRRVIFRDGAAGWRGRIRGLDGDDDAVPLWVVADAASLVMAFSYGQVECLNRSDGRSRWLYVFPAIDPVLLSTPHAWRADGKRRGYFVDRVKRYRNRIAGGGVAGTAVDGVPAAAVRVVVDPRPEEFLDPKWMAGGRTACWIAVVVFLVTALAMAVDVYYWAAKKTPPAVIRYLDARNPAPPVPAVLHFACMLVSSAAYYFFGGYARLSSWCLIALVVMTGAAGCSKLVEAVRAKTAAWKTAVALVLMAACIAGSGYFWLAGMS